MMARKNVIWTVGAIALLCVLATVSPAIASVDTGEKKEKSYLVRCAIVDGDKIVKVVYRKLNEKSIRRLEELFSRALEGGISKEKFSKLYHVLKEYRLIPDNINITAMIDKMFKRYENLSLNELRKEIWKQCPAFAPKIDAAISNVVASGINPNVKIRDLKTESDNNLNGSLPFNLLCILFYTGFGTLFIPPFWLFGILLHKLVCPLVVGIAAAAEISTLGLLLSQGGITSFTFFRKFIGVVLTFPIVVGIGHFTGLTTFTVALGGTVFTGFWNPGVYVP